jgi:hypothetical protein
MSPALSRAHARHMLAPSCTHARTHTSAHSCVCRHTASAANNNNNIIIINNTAEITVIIIIVVVVVTIITGGAPMRWRSAPRPCRRDTSRRCAPARSAAPWACDGWRKQQRVVFVANEQHGAICEATQGCGGGGGLGPWRWTTTTWRRTSSTKVGGSKVGGGSRGTTVLLRMLQCGRELFRRRKAKRPENKHAQEAGSVTIFIATTAPNPKATQAGRDE